MTSLLTALLDNPHDPDLRLAYAGAVEDGKLELPAVDLRGGEVVHDQYGVPLRVRCTMATWCGVECKKCLGRGSVYQPDYDGTEFYCGRCNLCSGRGRITGISAAVCGAWPVVGVDMTGVDVWDHNPNGTVSFWRQSEYQKSLCDKGNLHDDLFELIAELYPKNCVDLGQLDRRSHRIRFATKAVALAALPHAALTLGRRAAGLPDLAIGGKNARISTAAGSDW